MRPLPCLVVIAALGLSGCARIAESPLNPLNLFGGGATPARTAQGTDGALLTRAQRARIVDTRDLIAVVDSVALEPTPGGAIVRATGQASGRGFYDAALVPVAGPGDALVLEFRVMAPQTQPAGTGPQRITAALALSNADLAGRSVVTVMGAQTGRRVSR